MDDEPSFRPPPSVAGAGRPGREWQEIGNADVLVPKDVEYPLGVVHFVGGQGVGVLPKSAYGALLEGLVDAGECCRRWAVFGLAAVCVVGVFVGLHLGCRTGRGHFFAGLGHARPLVGVSICFLPLYKLVPGFGFCCLTSYSAHQPTATSFFAT